MSQERKVKWWEENDAVDGFDDGTDADGMEDAWLESPDADDWNSLFRARQLLGIADFEE